MHRKGLLSSFLCFRYLFPLAVCNLRQLLTLFPMIQSAFVFFLMALHRYLTIVHNKTNLTLFSLRSLSVLLPVSWLVSVCVTIPMAYPGDHYALSYPHYCIVFSDSIVLSLKVVPTILMLLPLVLVLVFYVHIFVFVRQASRRNSGKGSVSKAQSHMTRVLFVLYVTAALLYVPYMVLFYLEDIAELTRNRLYIVANVLLLLATIGIPLLNAFLFKPINKQYRILFRIPESRVTTTTTAITVQSVA